MNTKKTLIYLISAVVALGIVMAINISVTNKIEHEAPLTETEQEQQIAAMVQEFGAHLKNVALTAEPAELAANIQREYGPFVTTHLLERWLADTSLVPGRQTSSPWPERIEIGKIEKIGEYYQVSAEVVDMTSDTINNGQDAGRTSVYILVSPIEGSFKITEYQIANQ